MEHCLSRHGHTYRLKSRMIIDQKNIFIDKSHVYRSRPCLSKSCLSIKVIQSKSCLSIKIIDEFESNEIKKGMVIEKKKNVFIHVSHVCRLKSCLSIKVMSID